MQAASYPVRCKCYIENCLRPNAIPNTRYVASIIIIINAPPMST